MKEKIKVIVSDIDGTLLNENHRLSPETIEGIRVLDKTTALFMIATGRNLHDASRIRETLGVNAYLITSNGATITNPQGELVATTAVDPEIALAILRIPKPEGVLNNFYQLRKWYMEQDDSVFCDYYQDGDLTPTKCIFDEVVHDAPIDKLFFTSLNKTHLDQLRQEIEEKYSDEVVAYYSMPVCLEVMKKGVSKASGLKMVADSLGIPLTQFAAFGDAENDIEMLDEVGYGFMMANASEGLRKALPHIPIVGKNSEHGVVKKIKELIENDMVAMK